ncbi:hypothetical protein LINPERHAP2_LOCUS3302, partial [Linum perenne]
RIWLLQLVPLRGSTIATIKYVEYSYGVILEQILLMGDYCPKSNYTTHRCRRHMKMECQSLENIVCSINCH